jgi:acyl-coenzyme A thioesterase PaaI-like protein
LTFAYLRSARAVDTLARTIVTKHGRRVVNVRVEGWQDDPARPVATAQGHFLVAHDAAP